MRPSTRPTDEEYRKLLDEKVAPIDKKLDELNKRLDDTKLEGSEEVSVAETVEKMKGKGASVPKVIKTGKEDVVQDEGSDEGVFCPTCDQGKHEHKIDFKGRVGLTGKCTGDKCGEEFILVPKKPDYHCTTCGLPMKKDINEKNEIKSCPLCGNVRTLGFDLEEKIRMDPYRKVIK